MAVSHDLHLATITTRDGQRIEFSTKGIVDIAGIMEKLRKEFFNDAVKLLEHNRIEFKILPTRFPTADQNPLSPAHARQIGGDHYKNLKVEPWKAMESWLTQEEFKGFLKGNIIKYIARANSDKEPHDLMIQKAEHYMQKLSEVMAAEESAKSEN